MKRISTGGTTPLGRGDDPEINMTYSGVLALNDASFFTSYQLQQTSSGRSGHSYPCRAYENDLR
jgi:hypothetical protein